MLQGKEQEIKVDPYVRYIPGKPDQNEDPNADNEQRFSLIQGVFQTMPMQGGVHVYTITSASLVNVSQTASHVYGDLQASEGEAPSSTSSSGIGSNQDQTTVDQRAVITTCRE